MFLLSNLELQQIAINHSSHISTGNFVNIYRKCTAEPHLFFVNDTTLASNNLLSFRKNDKYEYLTGEDILPSNQQQIIEQAKFTYSLLGKAFEKQIKTIEDQGGKQIDAIENLKDTNKQAVNINDDEEDKLLHSNEREIFRNIYNKRLDKIEELTKKVDGNNLTFTILSTGETYNFTGKNDPLSLLNKIRNGEITIERAKD